MVFMPAAHPIALTAEEDRTLYELSLANGIARCIKLRATALRLNASGWPNICISVSIRCDRRSNAGNKVDSADCGRLRVVGARGDGKVPILRPSKPGCRSAAAIPAAGSYVNDLRLSGALS